MYFPFLKGKKRCERSAEIRRRNCAVLPSVFATFLRNLFSGEKEIAKSFWI